MIRYLLHAVSAFAFWNIRVIPPRVTDPIAQLEMSTLNEVATLNISRMLVTALVSHCRMSALKASALSNMLAIEVTLDVSQLLMSALNVVLSLKISLMSVTRLTSHAEISP